MASLSAAGARGGLVTLVSQIFTLLARMVGIFVLAHLLRPDVFGLVAIVTSITAFSISIIFLGLTAAVMQADSLSQRAKSSLFLINATGGLVLASALFFSAGLIADIYDDPRLVTIVQWLALVPLLSGLQSQFRLQLVTNLRFGALAISEIVGQTLATSVAIVMALNGATYEAVITQSVLVSATQFVMVVAAARWWPGLPGAWASEVRDLMTIGLRVFVTNFLKNASRGVLVPIMGLSQPAAALGNYDRAQQLTITPINLTVDQLQRVVVPVLSRLRGQPERMLSYMRRIQLVGAYGTATAFLVASALAQPLLTVLLGDEWLFAGTILQALAIGGVFRALGQSMQWLFISADATKQGLLFSLWTQPAVAAISLAGLPWGVLGVAIANSIAWAIYWPLATVAAAKAARFPARPLLVDVMRAVLCFGLPVAVAAWTARLFGVSDLATVGIGAGFAVAAAAIVFALVPPVRHDLGLLAKTLRLAVTGKGAA